MNSLSNRLNTIISQVDKNSRVLDVGCDHALVDISLYKKGIAKKIIASDINKNALNNAKKNIISNNLQDIIEVRLGNGLEVLTTEDKIDTVIISGMGTHTIIDIVKKKKYDIDTFIIQSNNNLELLRKEISSLGYKIVNEEIVFEGKKIYIIIKFKKGKEKYNKRELYFGPVLLKKNNNDFIKYKKINHKKLLSIYNLIPRKKIITRYKLKKEIKLYK